MLSKSLIQFSIDGWSFVPSLLITWAKLGGGNEDNGDLLQKIPCMYCYTLPPTLQQATTELRLRWRDLNTHRQVWVSLLWDHCSFLLGPGAQGSVCALQVSSFHSCVSSGSSVVGLMVNSSRRAYAIPKSAAPRAPGPEAVHCWPIPPQETLTDSSVSVSVGSLGPGAHKNLQGLSITLD